MQNYQQTGQFTRQIIAYPSDGLTIYGFMDIPPGNGPFPVIIALHGHVAPNYYQTLDYTTRYADSLAEAGYLVIHPNMRGFWPSDKGTNPLNIGLAIDVLNLIALVQNQGGKPGVLQQANPQAIGLWGHSMGGGVTIRVITINHSIRAAVLYSAVSSDDSQNFRVFYDRNRPAENEAGSIQPSQADYMLTSPAYYLDRIQTPISINQGLADVTVPPSWSTGLCTRLIVLKKPVECYLYPGEGHIFGGASDTLFVQRSIQFFSKYLK